MIEKNNPQIINAWCLYDWANSVYSLVIISTIFPVYFSAVAVNPDGGDKINFLGWQMTNTVLFSFAISFSFFIVGLLNPFLTAIADYSGKKKSFMRFFCYMGAIACAALFFFTSQTLIFAVFAFIIATIGFSGSIVFYNAYLPEITTEDQLDRVSARGFSIGYVGSVILLIVNLFPIIKPEWFGNISTGMASRIAFLCTGLWWFGFAQYTFYYLPSNVYDRKTEGNWIFNGIRELRKIIAELSLLPALRRFLLAFFFYSMGLQTVMYLATLFGDKELHLPADSLILTILILQLVAIVGAMVFAQVSLRIGNINTLILAVALWILICFGAYFTYTVNQFYLLAAFVGLVMGGIQAMSRSTYSKLIPPDTQNHASYFSFYDITEKFAIVFGTFSYGLIEQLTGSMRNSVLSLALFFIVGLLFLTLVPKRIIYHQLKQV